MKMWFKMLKKQLISLVIIIQLFVCATTKNFIHEREERDIFSSSRLHPFERVRRSVPNKFNNVRFRRSANSDDPDSVNTNPDEGKCRNPLVDDNLKQIIAKEFHFDNETSLSVSISWIGDKRSGESSTLLLLATSKYIYSFAGLFNFHIRKPSKLYISFNYGRDFQRINDTILDGKIQKDYGIMKSPVNPKKVILISFTKPSQNAKSELYITTNGAADEKERFKKVVLKFVTDGPVLFHPRKEDWLLIKGKTVDAKARKVVESAYLSTDFGFHWKKLKDHIQDVKWGAPSTETIETEEKTILITVVNTNKWKRIPGTVGFTLEYDADLYRSRDLGGSFRVIAKHVYTFGLQGKFLFISIDFNKNNRTRIMHVSDNGGDTFEPVNAPSVTPERFYSILDMSEGLIFLHIDEKGDTGYGTLYTSDADGIVYTKSLERHLYTNTGFTDFYRVKSMRGTYMTNVLNTDNTVTSYISWDRGAEWHKIPLTKKQCSDEGEEAGCTLQFHNLFSRSKGVSVAMPPLSEPNAAGLILTHGHAGKAVKRKADVWLSIDGGYKWTKVLSNPHFYSIADHGNLVVAAPAKRIETSNYIMYSLDMGQCWFKHEISKEPLYITGLVTEPGAKTMRFLVWGYKANKEWSVFTVEFYRVIIRQCVDDDYEKWVPHEGGKAKGCLLGCKITIWRPKKNKLCFNGVHYKAKQEKEKCTCTMADLECDYGYTRKPDSDDCKPDSSKKPKICVNDHIESIETKGYRRIPGDECTGGNSSLVKQLVETSDKCRNASLYEYGMINYQARSNSKTSKATVAAVVIPLTLLAIAGLLYFGKKYWDAHRQKPAFQYSELNQDEALSEDEDDRRYDPRPRGLRRYRDIPDDEDAPMVQI